MQEMFLKSFRFVRRFNSVCCAFKMLRAKILIFLVLLCCSHGELRSRKTQLKSAYERVFSRKKRAMIFPPGSFFKFTCNFGKGLLSSYPRGISFTLEEAVYFPIPGTRDDLYPKRFLPKSTTTPKPLTTTQETFVYIPGTDWRFKAQALPKPKPRPRPRPHLKAQPPKTQRIDDASYSNPQKWQQWATYGVNQADKWKSSANNHRWQMYNKTKWSKWTSPAPKWTKSASKWTTPAPKWTTSAPKWTTSAPKSTAPIPNWTTPVPKWSADWAKNWPRYRLAESRHYHGHRDRRQLFDHFSGLSTLFGIDVKSCILRTICDSKRLLLPTGYSMLQDMLRLVFAMPRLDGMEDDYTRVMSKDADTCALELKTKCSMNLLIWLLSGRLDKNKYS